MNGTSSEPASPSKLELIQTQLGFEVIADPGDYVSKLLMRDEIYEAPETDLVTRLVRRGDTCIDAGCQIGYHSCLLAKLVEKEGRVYSFDANPHACLHTKRNLDLNGFSFAEVIHTALADIEGRRSFHISCDHETGLSSLGRIPTIKETISVPCLRLDSFIKSRHIDRIRLLKLDVEGSEEIVLRGLGPFLSKHLIDYILVECFDERLQLLGTSPKEIATILDSSGYTPWEYGIDARAGWSKAKEVRSRGDCNYLFSSPEMTETPVSISLASVLNWTQTQKNHLLTEASEMRSQQHALENKIGDLNCRNEELELNVRDVLRRNAELLAQRNQLRAEKDELRGQRNELRSQNYELQRQRDELRMGMNKLQDDIDWLLESIKTHEQESHQLKAQNQRLNEIWASVETSASWRILNVWRNVRDRLLPEDSLFGRFYNSMIGPLRRR
jgi:FkbM family methyltransferase